MEAQLKGIVSRLGLEGQVADAFPQTTPMWHGLWAISPVPVKSVSLLRILMSEMLVEDKRDMEAAGKVDNNQLRDFAQFIKAAELAEGHNLRLHVSLLPLGHTDFGIYTVFPHCPFCKATARTAKWQRRYPTARQTCEVCGMEFSPAETATMTRSKWNRDELRDTLGEERFLRFAREYLIAQGESAESADAIVLETEAENKRRDEKQRAEAELRALKDKHLKERVFIGLKTVSPPPSEIEDDKEESGVASIPWFDAENFAETIRRARDAGISITYMTHHSATGDLDRHQWQGITDPLSILATWKQEGCSEKFSAGFRVPDALIHR